MPRRASEFWPTVWAWVVPAVTALSVVASLAPLGRGGRSAAGVPPAKVWTKQELEDRFVLGSMDDIEPVLGKASSASVDGAGNISALHYRDFPVVNNTGKDRVTVTFLGSGNRCTAVGVPYRDASR